MSLKLKLPFSFSIINFVASIFDNIFVGRKLTTYIGIITAAEYIPTSLDEKNILA